MEWKKCIPFFNEMSQYTVCPVYSLSPLSFVLVYLSRIPCVPLLFVRIPFVSISFVPVPLLVLALRGSMLFNWNLKHRMLENRDLWVFEWNYIRLVHCHDGHSVAFVVEVSEKLRQSVKVLWPVATFFRSAVVACVFLAELECVGDYCDRLLVILQTVDWL